MTFEYPTRIHLGVGALARLQEECDHAAINKPLVVTDKGVRDARVLAKVLAALNNPAPPVFVDVPGRPTERAVRLATSILQASECDGIIAVGGGTMIDLAKGVALFASHDNEGLMTFSLSAGRAHKITAATLPIVAVPTNSDKGREANRAAVIILDDDLPVDLLSPHLIPKAAICDPGLTISPNHARSCEQSSFG